MSPGEWAVSPAIEICLLIVLIKLSAQGNELWPQPLNILIMLIKLSAQGSELWAQWLRYVNYANTLW